MRILLIGDINSGLMAAKVGPLIVCPWVHDIVFVSQYAGPPHPKVSYVVIADRPGLMRRNLRRVRAALGAMRRRPDVIVAYNVNPFGYLAWLLSRIHGVPYAIGMISGRLEIEAGGSKIPNRFLDRFPFLAPLNERLTLAVLRRALFVTTTGTATKGYAVARGIAAARVYALSSTVDPELYRPIEMIERDIDIVCVSQLIPRKRIDRLLEIAAILRPHRPTLKIVVVGEGPLHAELEAKALAMGLDACISFAGWQRDVRPLLWRARVFTLTSFSEGLPLALIEAMACGVPSVVGRFGDVADLVHDGVNGRLVSEGDVEAYANAIGELLADPEHRRRIAAAAVETVARHYTFAAGAAKWAEIHADWLALRAVSKSNDP